MKNAFTKHSTPTGNFFCLKTAILQTYADKTTKREGQGEPILNSEACCSQPVIKNLPDNTEYRPQKEAEDPLTFSD